MAADEVKRILTSVERYFMQQQDLFGNVIYGDRTPKKQTITQQSISGEPWAGSLSLKELDKEIHECLKCPLGHTRTNFVFGTGNEHADVMFLGEAPGADEDAEGEPFVGRAGQLLNKIIEAVGMKREEVYICNILKCRPPNNRAPIPSEVESCTPYLKKQIELIKPKFIICLGRTAAQWLLQTNESLGTLRGKVHEYEGIKFIVTYHPAALLRNPEWKRPTWEDMKMFKRLYDEMKQAG